MSQNSPVVQSESLDSFRERTRKSCFWEQIRKRKEFGFCWTDSSFVIPQELDSSPFATNKSINECHYSFYGIGRSLALLEYEASKSNCLEFAMLVSGIVHKELFCFVAFMTLSGWSYATETALIGYLRTWRILCSAPMLEKEIAPGMEVFKKACIEQLRSQEVDEYWIASFSRKMDNSSKGFDPYGALNEIDLAFPQEIGGEKKYQLLDILISAAAHRFGSMICPPEVPSP